MFFFFEKQKNVFLQVCKALFSKPDTIMQSGAHKQELLVYLGMHSQPHDISWLFLVYLNETLQYKVFQELGIYLPGDSYLSSLHLVVDTVKTMFKWIFLSLIVTPCCT